MKEAYRTNAVFIERILMWIACNKRNRVELLECFKILTYAYLIYYVISDGVFEILWRGRFALVRVTRVLTLLISVKNHDSKRRLIRNVEYRNRVLRGHSWSVYCNKRRLVKKLLCTRGETDWRSPEKYPMMIHEK